MVVYVDDSLIFGPSLEPEKNFSDSIIKMFKLEFKILSHWFMGAILYKEKDGSYILNQED